MLQPIDTFQGLGCLQLHRNLGDGPFLCGHLRGGKVDSKLRWRGVGLVFCSISRNFNGYCTGSCVGGLHNTRLWPFIPFLKTECPASG